MDATEVRVAGMNPALVPVTRTEIRAPTCELFRERVVEVAPAMGAPLRSH